MKVRLSFELIMMRERLKEGSELKRMKVSGLEKVK
jgi:hypothetical protein